MSNAELLFTRHGFRFTRQREVIYSALAATTKHPTADELFKQISDRNDLSIATVYNALELFCDVGLARRLPGAGTRRSARYDASVKDHVHARCIKTGRVFDVPEPISRKIIRKITPGVIEQFENESNFKVHDIYIELTGECQVKS